MTIRIALLCCGLIACSGPLSKDNKASGEVIKDSNIEKTQPTTRVSKYDFQTPSETFVLDRNLKEISGLAFNPKDNTFISNNDESGYIFTLNPKTFEIISREKFAKRGDYEAIEIIGDNVIVSKNTGKLYFYNQSTKETTSYPTELGARNDVEGLHYEQNSNSLLIACKGHPLTKSETKKNEKCIYRFDLEKKKLILEPYLSITDGQLKSFVNSNFTDISKSKRKKLKNRTKNFSPSGIAIHPVSGDYFIISAKGSIIVIIDKNKMIKDVVFLNNKTNPQPEGICFDIKNNLYIGTEGQGFSGKIFKYNYNG